MSDITPESLEWAFKKLKSHYHYYYGSLYLKKRIKEYEDQIKAHPGFFDALSDRLNSISPTDKFPFDINYLLYPKKRSFTNKNNIIECNGINVFIDMDISLFLVDVIFAINIIDNVGHYINKPCSYGGNYDERLDDANNKINNIFLIENYRRRYNEWKNGLKGLNRGDLPDNLSVLKLDLEKCFYYCRFNFTSIVEKIGIQNNQSTIIMKSIYNIYTDILFNKVLSFPKDFRETILPLGLLSSALLFNYLFDEIDYVFESNNSVVKYGRYVDDMLIVLNDDYSSKPIDCLLEEMFGDIFSNQEGKIYLKSNNAIQKDMPLNINKCSIVSFRKNDSESLSVSDIFNGTSLIDYDDELRDNDPNFIVNEIRSVVFEMNDESNPQIDKLYKYSDIDMLNSYPIWKDLLKNDNSEIIYLRIRRAIQKVSKVSGYDNGELLLNKLKRNLDDELTLARLLSNVKAEEYNYMVNISFQDKYEYIKTFVEGGNIEPFFPETTSIANISFFLSMEEIKKDACNDSFVNKVKQIYKKINNVTNVEGFDCTNYHVDNVVKRIRRLSPIEEIIQDKEYITIALAALNYKYEYKEGNIEKDYSNYDLSVVKKIMLEASLASKDTPCYLLFPELSIDLEWVDDMIKYARKRHLSFICGLKHIQAIVKGKSVYLNITVLFDHNSGLVLLKPKNYIPYRERQAIIFGLKGEYYEPTNPYYYVIDDGIISFSFMTCFEATNIVDRASLTDEIEVLFMPVLNKDTHYFSNIVESFSRDASCYIAQANSNSLGDSRIHVPKRHYLANIVRVKGGINTYCVADKLSIKLLRDEHVNFKSFLAGIDLKIDSGDYDGKIKPFSAGSHYKK